jgi:hypothetical protein
MYEDLEKIDDKAPVNSGLLFNVVVKKDDDEERFETELLEVDGKPYEEGACEKMTVKNERRR